MTQLLDDIAEFFWQIDSLGKIDDHDQFIQKAKPIIKDLINNIRQGGAL